MFKNIGRIGIEMFLLFQHHTTHDFLLRMSHDDMDLFTITGTGWHFIKYLGPAVVVVGPDTRSERTLTQVMAGSTYQGLFPKVALLPSSVQHCIWMIPVPVIYPRLESMEHLASTMATGKKLATGTFNVVGKVSSSMAGILGAKGVVQDGFSSVKKAVGKSGLMSGMLSPFGEIDFLDELRDQWTHESKVRLLLPLLSPFSISLSSFSPHSPRKKLTVSATGPGADVPDPHATRDRAQQVAADDVPERRREPLRGGASARPSAANRPQDHVPADLVAGGQRAPEQLHPAPAAQQQGPLCAGQRRAQLACALGHQGGHAGDLWSGRGWPAARA
jgi:hypothetical protein